MDLLALAHELIDRRLDAKNSAINRGKRAHGDSLARPAERPRPRESGGNADDVVDVRAHDCTSEAFDAEACVCNNRNRTDAQTRVQHGGEVSARGDENAYAISRLDSMRAHAARELRDALFKQAPRNRSRPFGEHLHDCGFKGRCRIARTLRDERSEALIFGLLGVGRHGTLAQIFTLDETLIEPATHDTRNGRVLPHKMRRTLEAMHIRVRYTLKKITKVAVRKHDISRPPHHEGRDGHALETFGKTLQGRARRVFCTRRDIGHKGFNSATARLPTVRSVVALAHLARQRRLGKIDGRAEESVGARGRER